MLKETHEDQFLGKNGVIGMRGGFKNGNELMGLHLFGGGGFSAGTPIAPIFERLSVTI